MSDVLDLAALTSIVRHLAVEHRATQEAIAGLKLSLEGFLPSKSDKSSVFRAPVTVASILDEIRKLAASTDTLKQELRHARGESTQNNDELRGHLIHMDSEFARSKDEMILLAKQVVTVDASTKTWQDRISRDLAASGRDAAERAAVTARLCDKLMHELNAQRARCEELEQRFLTTARQFSLLHTEAHSSTLLTLQHHFDAVTVHLTAANAIAHTAATPALDVSPAGAPALPFLPLSQTGHSSPQMGGHNLLAPPQAALPIPPRPASSLSVSSTPQPSIFGPGALVPGSGSASPPPRRAGWAGQSSGGAEADTPDALAQLPPQHQRLLSSAAGASASAGAGAFGRGGSTALPLGSAAAAAASSGETQGGLLLLRRSLESLSDKYQDMMQTELASVRAFVRDLKNRVEDELTHTRTALSTVSATTSSSVSTVSAQLSALGSQSSERTGALATRVAALEAAVSQMQLTVTTKLAAVEGRCNALGKDCYTAFKSVEERLDKVDKALEGKKIEQESEALLKATQLSQELSALRGRTDRLGRELTVRAQRAETLVLSTAKAQAARTEDVALQLGSELARLSTAPAAQAVAGPLSARPGTSGGTGAGAQGPGQGRGFSGTVRRGGTGTHAAVLASTAPSLPAPAPALMPASAGSLVAVPLTPSDPSSAAAGPEPVAGAGVLTDNSTGASGGLGARGSSRPSSARVLPIASPDSSGFALVGSWGVKGLESGPARPGAVAAALYSSPTPLAPILPPTGTATAAGPGVATAAAPGGELGLAASLPRSATLLSKAYTQWLPGSSTVALAAVGNSGSGGGSGSGSGSGGTNHKGSTHGAASGGAAPVSARKTALSASMMTASAAAAVATTNALLGRSVHATSASAGKYAQTRSGAFGGAFGAMHSEKVALTLPQHAVAGAVLTGSAAGGGPGVRL